MELSTCRVMMILFATKTTVILRKFSLFQWLSVYGTVMLSGV